ALILSRQALPILDREKYTSADGLARGAYVLADLGKQKPQIALIASGSEVDLIVKAGEELAEQGVSARLISMPSWDLFEKQSDKYKKSVLPESMKMRIAIEAGSTLGWDRYIGDKGIALGIDHFGASAPGNIVLGKFGITVDNVVDAAKKMLGGGI
ncbi:MAG TPA: transketolase C-terminal domain-containing protein, partial [Bellilinea sp.]|nr:transketolase C-terminal domain-containing protein [Bellilinea sp.]